MPGKLIINIALFLISFLGIFVIGGKLTFYSKILSKLTGLGEAFIGTVLISMITSLPELSSGFSAVFIAKNPNLMIADVFGSDLFNITVLWGILLSVLLTKKNMVSPAKEHNETIILYIIVPVLLFGMYFFPAIRSVLFLSIPSIIFLFLLPRIFKLYGKLEVDEPDEFEIPQKQKNLTKKNVIFLFVFYSLLIIGFGLILGKTADFIAKYDFKGVTLGSSFVGAIFLAISTSLPEVAVTIHAIFRYNAVNLAYGNILGSNLFNVIIFVLGDIFTFKTPLINILSPGNRIVLATLAFSSILFIIQGKSRKGIRITLALISIIVYLIAIKFIFGG